jgi:hypothetical protein
MRFLANSMLAVLVAVAIAGCSGGSSNSSDNSTTASSADNSAASSDNSASSSDNTAASSDNTAASPAAASGEMPAYPGATTAASGSSSMGSMGGAASGKVLTTTDSFDKVYAWYQKNAPAGSEKSHMTTPVKSAVFMIGETGKDMQSVTISTSGGKTMIAIAHVKQ